MTYAFALRLEQPRPSRGSGLPAAVAAAGLALLGAGAFEYFVISTGEDARFYLNPQGVALFSAMRGGLLVLAAALFLPRLHGRLMVAFWPVAFVYGWLMLTLLWTPMPRETISGLFRLACALMPGLWVATAPDREAAMARLGQAGLFVLAVTLVAVILVPDLAFMHGRHEGALRGPFLHKNTLGFHLALAGLIFLCRMFDTRSLFWLAAYLLAAAGILLAQATAALLAVTIGAGLILGLVLCMAAMGRWAAPFLFILSTLAIPLTWLLPELAGLVVGPLDYELGLNGRDLVWSFAANSASLGGLLGFGYEAFWPRILPAGAMGFVHAWLPAHAHNGFLDAWLAGGAVGVALVAALFAILWWRGLQALALKGPAGTRAFPFVATSVLLAYNGIETLFPAGTTFAPALIVVLLALPVLPERRQ